MQTKLRYIVNAILGLLVGGIVFTIVSRFPYVKCLAIPLALIALGYVVYLLEKKYQHRINSLLNIIAIIATHTTSSSKNQTTPPITTLEQREAAARDSDEQDALLDFEATQQLAYDCYATYWMQQQDANFNNLSQAEQNQRIQDKRDVIMKRWLPLKTGLENLAFAMLMRDLDTVADKPFCWWHLGRNLKPALASGILEEHIVEVDGTQLTELRFRNQTIHEYFLTPLVASSLRVGYAKHNQMLHHILEVGKRANVAVPGLIKGLQAGSMLGGEIGVLGQLGDKRAIEPLRSFLKHRNHSFRSAAALALGNIGDVRVVPDLIKALKDNNDDVVESAIIALGTVGDPTVVELIIPFLKARDIAVEYAARNFLRDIGTPEALAALRKHEGF